MEDIVTLRAGKNVSFHIYLNSGKFVLFKAESLDSQSSWMAEIKMALGKGMILSIARLPRDSEIEISLCLVAIYIIDSFIFRKINIDNCKGKSLQFFYL